MQAYRYQLVLLCTIVFGVFYLTVYGDLCIVDDFSNIMDWSNATDVSLKRIFIPGSVGGGYYRPLVGLSYLVNLRLWDLDSRMLHLENVLLHTANALLVYLFARSLLLLKDRGKSLIPLAAGLIFGLHPITCESVDWISGRTDLIAGFFVLLAAILLVRYRGTGSFFALLGAGLCVLLGMLGKEVALGFLPGALFLLATPPEEVGSGGAARPPAFNELLWFLLLAGGSMVAELLFFNFWVVLATAPLYGVVLYRSRPVNDGRGAHLGKLLRRLLACLAAMVLAVGILFAVRRLVFVSNIPRIPQTLKLMAQDPNHTISVFLASAGFYLKKFLLPLPLNFAIREIDPLYAMAGTVLLFVAIRFAAKRNLSRSLVLVGVFMFLPALPLALGTVAWTAYAERYIYVSSAFWSVALVFWLAPRLAPLGKGATIAVVSVLLVAGVITVQRNLVWHDSLGIVRDTVKKSPKFKEMRAIYMAELIKAGDLQGATEQYRVANSLPSGLYIERLDTAMADIFLKQGKEDQALGLYQRVFYKTGGTSELASRQISYLLARKITRETGSGGREMLRLQPQRYSRPAIPGADSNPTGL